MTGPKQRQLEIDGISKRYGQTVAVQDLTFEIRRTAAPGGAIRCHLV